MPKLCFHFFLLLLARFQFGQMDTTALGVNNVLVVNQQTAYQAMDRIDNAIQTVSSERARIGAYINRLDHTLANLAVQEENQTAAESTIRESSLYFAKSAPRAAPASMKQSRNIVMTCFDIV